MNVEKWLRDNRSSRMHYNIAEGILMSGPRATRPTFRAVRKMLGRLKRGDKPRTRNGWSSWRSARSV